MIKNNRFYLVNIKTKRVFNKPFKTQKESLKEIEQEYKTEEGFILIERIKGFEDIISLTLSKYPNLLKKILLINDLKGIKERKIKEILSKTNKTNKGFKVFGKGY